jgi:Ca-activated chloride channel family protein
MRAQGCQATLIDGLLVLVIFFAMCLPQVMRAQGTDAKPSSKTRSQGTQNLNPGDDRVLINTDLISFNVTITDQYGRFVSGLQQSAFTVFDDKQAQDITFFSDDDAPVSLGIVFDLTGSMSGDKVRRAKEALEHFFQTSRDGDEYFLITLQNGRAALALDRTPDSQAVLNKLTFVQPQPSTMLVI